MRITCLMENTVGNEKCQVEHGLSLYVEMENNTYLIDTGASDSFMKNAEHLGINLSKVEAVFLSHGHYDHAGGILPFCQKNLHAKIILQKKAFGDFWHKSETTEKYIGIDSSIRLLKNLQIVDGDCKYEDNVDIFTGDYEDKSRLIFWTKGNLILKEKVEGKYFQDDFSHEQYIVLREGEKLILLSGCAHNGILNILETFREKYNRNPDVVISGFHMKKKSGYTKEDILLIEETAKRLKATDILCYTGHCTGEEPYQIMKEIMGEQLQYVHCGDVIEL